MCLKTEKSKQDKKWKRCPKKVENRIENEDRIKSDVVYWGYVKVLVDPLSEEMYSPGPDMPDTWHTAKTSIVTTDLCVQYV